MKACCFQDYQGHVFWDQETWMYPPVLLLHSDIAQLLLRTRQRTASAARSWAAHNGNQGIQFPWESGLTGSDVTPAATCSRYEQHISGDIAFSIDQYLRATGDVSILHSNRYNVTFLEILEGIATFWKSRLQLNKTSGKFNINGFILLLRT